jgi:hypothetical protein
MEKKNESFRSYQKIQRRFKNVGGPEIQQGSSRYNPVMLFNLLFSVRLETTGCALHLLSISLFTRCYSEYLTLSVPIL